MKITLIQIDLVMGSRVLLSLLREKGYDAKSLQINTRYTDLLSDGDLKAVYGYAADSDVVGLSFNTFYALQARQLAVFLKNKGIKYIITGGNHATALPDEVIKYSDIVVKHEAEVTLPGILEALEMNKPLSGVKGIVYRENKAVFHSSHPPDIVWKLDTLPFQSTEINAIKYFDPKRKLYTPDNTELFPNHGNCYFVLASRGCPFGCAYCSNSLYRSIDPGFKKVRKRSIGNIVDEMEQALSAGFESFYITDDHFFAFTEAEIGQFNREYKKRIKKPFSVVGINPNIFRQASAEKKLRLLINCGMTDIRIGIQSGSDKTLEIFKRGYKAAEIPGLIAPVEKIRKTIWGPPYDKLHVALDFICDAPWETEEDKRATIKLARKALKQYSIFFYTLVYLPGTEIYSLALKNRWISDKEKDIYLRGIAGVDDNIYNRVLFLIAVTKERGIDLSEKLIDHILEVSGRDLEMAKKIIDSFIESVNKTEKHHDVKLKHAALHPYLTGFNEWVKTKGEVGRKVLFRSYHEPYG